MSALPTPEESPTSTLSAASRTLIQTTTEEWCGPSNPRLNGDSASMLRSGINQILGLIDVVISSHKIRDLTLDSLGMGDGDVDLIELASRITKEMAKDVCIEFRANISNGRELYVGPGNDPSTGHPSTG